MKRKGLSQILYLIIAASVLMMAALTVIFAFNQGVLGIGADTQKQICKSQLERKCRGYNNKMQIKLPNSCTRTVGGEERLRGGIGDLFKGLNSGDTAEAGDQVQALCGKIGG
ncbi:MAG: hypothetical protein ABEK01_03585 [Candidatus Nanohaloarchaea archaeon]